MKGFAARSIAALTIVVTIAVGTPVVAFAGTTATATTATTPAPITTLKQYRAAEKLYLAKLKVINFTFLEAVDIAKSNFATALSNARNSTQRISARADMRLVIADATIARAQSLTALGKAPQKPIHKTAVMSVS